jgi:hypothetical protein
MNDPLSPQQLSQSLFDGSYCPILELPDELLYYILSYSLDSLAEDRLKKWDLITHFMQIPIAPPPKLALVLRAVCRHFRALVNDMPFWHSVGFDPTSFLPPTRQSTWDQQLFLHLLFLDRHLADNLGRKSHWMFSTVQNILTVYKDIPYFRQNVVSVEFHKFIPRFDDPNQDSSNEISESPLNIAIYTLSFCGFLTSLRIGPTTAPCNLDALSICCPALKLLALHDNGNLSGTLSLVYLQKFELHLHDSPGLTTEHVSKVIPYLSKWSLYDLRIHTAMRLPAFYTSEIFDRYIFLTSLDIDPLTPLLCDYLIQTQHCLSSLTTHFNSVRGSRQLIDQFIDALKAPSLSDMTFLSLTIDTADDTALIRITPIIHCITSNLQSLRFVEMDMGLDIRWCELFSNLQDMEFVDWTIRNVEDAFVSRLEVGPEEEEEAEDKKRLKPGEEAMNAFKGAFKDFEVLPKIIIFEESHWD